jgi:hypothetical protein
MMIPTIILSLGSIVSGTTGLLVQMRGDRRRSERNEAFALWKCDGAMMDVLVSGTPAKPPRSLACRYCGGAEWHHQHCADCGAPRDAGNQ